MADAFYAPVAFRFRTYGVDPDGAAGEYLQTLLAHPLLRQWEAAALKETAIIDADEPRIIYRDKIAAAAADGPAMSDAGQHRRGARACRRRSARRLRAKTPLDDPRRRHQGLLRRSERRRRARHVARMRASSTTIRRSSWSPRAPARRLADVVETLRASRPDACHASRPRSGAGATLGGAVAAGLSGPRRPYAGAMRDIVLGVRMFDGRGEELRSAAAS